VYFECLHRTCALQCHTFDDTQTLNTNKQ
jgi:hypothetical protein